MEWNDQLMDEALRKSAAAWEDKYPAGLSSAAEIWTIVKQKRQKSHIVWLRRWSVAAAIVLLVTTAAIWFAGKNNSLPVARHPLQPIQMPATENEAITYIHQLCRGGNIACRSVAFKELQSALDAASSEFIAINQQIKLFGSDEQLLKIGRAHV